MTAAWQNLEVVNTGTPPKSMDLRDDDVLSSPIVNAPKVTLAVTLFSDRIEVAEDHRIYGIRHISNQPDYARLRGVLAGWKQRYPARKDLLLATENRAPYRHLIQLMDVFTSSDFPEVGITLN